MHNSNTFCVYVTDVNFSESIMVSVECRECNICWVHKAWPYTWYFVKLSLVELCNVTCLVSLPKSVYYVLQRFRHVYSFKSSNVVFSKAKRWERERESDERETEMRERKRERERWQRGRGEVTEKTGWLVAFLCGCGWPHSAWTLMLS